MKNQLGIPSKIAVVLLAVAALSTACSSTGPNSEVSKAHLTGEWILFASDRTDNWEIYRMHSDGSSVRRLTESAAYDWAPSFSPDGSQIAFSSNYLVGEVKQTGSEVNGEWVVEGFEELQEQEIFLMDSDGNNLRALTDNTLAVDNGPDWSPDGSQIVFYSDLNQESVEIYSINVDGTGLKQLTELGANNWDPSWSPDGQQIVFSSLLSEWLPYVMEADGSNLRFLEETGPGWKFSWSPSGDRIAFSSNRDGNWNIYVIDADGTNVVQLTSDSTDEHDPVWSPSGQQIAFAANKTGPFEIFIIDADGKSLVNNLADENVFATGQAGFPSDWARTP